MKIAAIGFVLMALLGACASEDATTPHEESAGSESADSLSPEDEAQLRAFFHEYGVATTDQDALIMKLEQGSAWLSMTPGALPVKETPYTRDGMRGTISTYADASIAVRSVSAQAGQYPGTSDSTTARSVRGCSVSGTGPYATYWKNCVADVNLGVIRMYFNFNYEYVQGTATRITAYSNPGYVIIGGTLENRHFVRQSPSDVRLTADLSVAFKGFPAGWTAYMGVRVSGTSATTYNN